MQTDIFDIALQVSKHGACHFALQEQRTSSREQIKTFNLPYKS